MLTREDAESILTGLVRWIPVDVFTLDFRAQTGGYTGVSDHHLSQPPTQRVEFYRAHAIQIQRVLTDSASTAPFKLFAAACEELSLRDLFTRVVDSLRHFRSLLFRCYL